MFSDNEGIEEVPTESIKFLMLPFLLATITMKRKCKPMGPPTELHGDLPERTLLMKLSKAYYKDFITRCKVYGVTTVSVPEEKEELSNSASGANSDKPTPQARSY